MNIILLDEACFDGKNATIKNTKQLTHIKAVLKAKVGDTLKIGKKDGHLGTGLIDNMTDDAIGLTDIVLDKSPPNKLGVTVMLALPRPKVLRRLMMDMTAMGVNHIILINSARTDKSYWGSPLLANIDEFIAEGLWQGVDTIAPKVTLAKRFKPFIEDDLPSLISPNQAVVFHPYDAQPFKEFCQDNGLPKFVAIGAEGGFVPYEIALFKSVGVMPVGLGQRILRTESAVNAVLGRYLL